MFTNRSQEESISYTFFGAVVAMPAGFSIKAGDLVTLMQGAVSIEVQITSVLPTAIYSGVVVAIDSEDQTPPSLVNDLKVGMSVELSQQQIHRCMRLS